jgi:hypothetical protein
MEHEHARHFCGTRQCEQQACDEERIPADERWLDLPEQSEDS